MLEQEQSTHVVTLPEQAIALLNPLRAEILNQLAEPASAAEVARGLNETPQRINYHLKALEKAGLVRKIGTRQVRNLVEVLFQSIAKTFILSDALGLSPEAVQRMKDQSSLSHLMHAAERMKRDALQLMELSDSQTEIPSASLHAQVQFKDAGSRKTFLDEYMGLVKQLVEKYQITDAKRDDTADAYQMLLALYPAVRSGGTGNE